ncbi:hypothetical protein D9757_010212 [Collybiopsis confluens]|uniref:Mog1p/PsbP-like protein n=1 Tax=Collybiopsis confluens TaxID=2823264 RepID=A0A8H5GP23_9AGAR|nr:hypothetical protein D9757_010212 [Collybiopsis confluens]
MVFSQSLITLGLLVPSILAIPSLIPRQAINNTTCALTITFDIVTPVIAQLDFRWALLQAFQANFPDQTVDITLGAVTPNNDGTGTDNTTSTISVDGESSQDIGAFVKSLEGQDLDGDKVLPEPAEYTIEALEFATYDTSQIVFLNSIVYGQDPYYERWEESKRTVAAVPIGTRYVCVFAYSVDDNFREASKVQSSALLLEVIEEIKFEKNFDSTQLRQHRWNKARTRRLN